MREVLKTVVRSKLLEVRALARTQVQNAGNGTRSGADTSAPGACAPGVRPDLLALVAHEKIVAVRQVATRRLVLLTSLPDDVTRLYETVLGGDPDAGTVWLLSQGGPPPSWTPGWT